MEHTTLENRLRILPLFDTVIMPYSTAKILVEHDSGQKIADELNEGHPFVISLAAKGVVDQAHLTEHSFYETGTLLRLDSVQPTEKGTLIFFKAMNRVNIETLTLEANNIHATYAFPSDEQDLDDASRRSMTSFMLNLIKEISAHFQGAEDVLKQVEGLQSPEELIGFAMPYMAVSVPEKQALLEMDSEKQRGLRFIDLLTRHKASIELQIEMAQKFNKRVNKNHREALLREQLRAIQDELGEGESPKNGKKNYKTLIENAGMPEDVMEMALAELDKLEAMGPQHHEAGMLRNYLDLLTDLPWRPGTAPAIDLDKARSVLDDQHYGLEKVKERIIQHLAVMALKKDKKGSILLLVGPPGTGKTSLGKSIAEALGRPYVRMSLGGIKDEAEIRGHRRTYIGALPGRILQGMKKAGQKNPVFVLDEVDKLMAAYSGDPASALLEVLDPEQNNSFSDHYLEVPYDLSEVFFVATANNAATIPGPLLDRMEVISISSYTNLEKFVIGQKHLMPQVLEEHGLDPSQLEVEDRALHEIIEKYTREAGVRGLKKQLSKIARVASEKIVSGKAKEGFHVQSDMLNEVLGKPVTRLDEALKGHVPGVATGLAWTPVGGDILFMECTAMPGKGELILTGQLGDVMKESARISQSLVRSRLAHMIGHFDFAKNDIHIHVPSGAIPKDGPSAGITLFTALASLLLGKTVDNTLAMTGEITLRGSVLPVGGIKEKILAAHRAGMKTIILSKENEADLKEIPQEVKASLNFIFVKTIEQVIKAALHVELPKPGSLAMPAGTSMGTTSGVKH